MDFCFPMDSEMKSDSKLDFVEKLFAIDTDPKNLFTTQVTMPGDFFKMKHSKGFCLLILSSFFSHEGDGRLRSGDVGSLHPHGR